MGICKFNYRSQACGLWLDVIVTIPTSQFSYYDMNTGTTYSIHDGKRMMEYIDSRRAGQS